MMKYLIAAILFASFVQSTSAAPQARIGPANITEIWTDGRAGEYGGCLVEISVDPNTVDPSCQFGKVSLSCDGNVGVTRANAAINLSMIQLAFVTSNPVDLWIDANKNAGGACVATSVWLAAP